MKCKVFEPSIIKDSEEYININTVAQAKGLKSNRSLRIEINKLESKYISKDKFILQINDFENISSIS